MLGQVACGKPLAPSGASLSKESGTEERPALPIVRPPRSVAGAAEREEPPRVTPSAPLPPFPAELPLHTPVDVPLDGDRPLRVAHAPGGVQHVAVYLHGMCGDPAGADPWIDLVTPYATVVTVRANVKCPDRPGYKWPQDPGEIQTRIDAALEHVRELRNGHLNVEEVTLIGYSQGSHRGEKLAAAFPERYRDLVLGGPPTAADPALLKGARAVALLGGELEETTHMIQGELALATAGIRSKFFLLPRAHHGTYGPEGRRVMSEVLLWLWPNGE